MPEPMIDSAMLYGGAAIVIAWGIAHIVIPTKDIVDGFDADSWNVSFGKRQHEQS